MAEYWTRSSPADFSKANFASPPPLPPHHPFSIADGGPNPFPPEKAPAVDVKTVPFDHRLKCHSIASIGTIPKYFLDEDTDDDDDDADAYEDADEDADDDADEDADDDDDDADEKADEVADDNGDAKYYFDSGIPDDEDIHEDMKGGNDEGTNGGTDQGTNGGPVEGTDGDLMDIDDD